SPSPWSRIRSAPVRRLGLSSCHQWSGSVTTLAFPRNHGHFYLSVASTTCQEKHPAAFPVLPDDSQEDPMKLTKMAVAALMLPLGKDDHIEWDEDLKRFGRRLRRSGDKVIHAWVVQYRHAGQTRRMTLDSILTAEQARDEATKILAKVALGQD